MLTLEQAKLYCRIDNQEEDELIKSLIDVADEYIKTACGEYDTNNPKAKLCQRILVNHWYENRAATGSTKGLKYSLDNLLLQIRYGNESRDDSNENESVQ